MTDTPDYTIHHDRDLNTDVPIYDHTRAQRIGLLHKALDWLDANPEKHTFGALAEDQHGKSVEPNDPAATCWCVLGRMVVEGALAPSRIRTPEVEAVHQTFYPTLDYYTQPFTGVKTCSIIHQTADHNAMLTETSQIPSLLQNNRDALRSLYPMEADAE